MRSGPTKRAAIHSLAIAVGLCGTGCTVYGHINETPVSKALAPMPRPDWPVGTTWHWLETWRLLDSGRKVSSRLVAKSENGFTRVDTNGCRVTKEDWFAPASLVRSRRRECDDRIWQVERTGDPWPLQVGKSWSYIYSYRLENRKYECRVESSVRVEIGAGGFDTYKVVCTTRSWKGTWYMSPILGTYAVYIDDPVSATTTHYEYLATDSQQ